MIVTFVMDFSSAARHKEEEEDKTDFSKKKAWGQTKMKKPKERTVGKKHFAKCRGHPEWAPFLGAASVQERGERVLGHPAAECM